LIWQNKVKHSLIFKALYGIFIAVNSLNEHFKRSN
jgi:hypothetical protein